MQLEKKEMTKIKNLLDKETIKLSLKEYFTKKLKTENIEIKDFDLTLLENCTYLIIEPQLSPIIKWAGGKRWILPYLRDYINNDTKLMEPFCGGLAVSLGLRPKYALLNDLNKHLINFYQNIKDGVFFFNIEYENDKELYYSHRNNFNEYINEYDNYTANLFYYLNKTCYNGLFRVNKKGLFNVPYGKYKNIQYSFDLEKYGRIFQNYNFSSLDFEKLNTKGYNFIYADPPYDDGYVSYTKEGFSWDDQIRLIKWLMKQNIKFAISNKATDRIVELYKICGLDIKLIDAPRRISSNGNRDRQQEILGFWSL